MFRKTFVVWSPGSKLALLGLNPLHRYSESTFHDGGHRQAPGDSIPWKDSAIPINRIKQWWFTPAGKGSMLISWAITMSLGMYCMQLSADSKINYRTNNMLVRQLHIETRRADMHQERAKELYQSVVSTVEKEANSKVTHKKSLQECTDSKDELQGSVVNFSGELSRERARNDLQQKRNQGLVSELIAVRTELAEVKRENTRLVEETGKLRKLVQKMQA